MIRHIVLFRLGATEPDQRALDAAGIRERLEALVGQVDGLRSLVVKEDLGLVEDHWHIALVSEHDDNAALEGYQAHPKHKEAGAFVRSVTIDRATVDFEV